MPLVVALVLVLALVLQAAAPVLAQMATVLLLWAARGLVQEVEEQE